MLNVVEHCRVAPPSGTVAEKLLPLTFLDLPWLYLPPVHRVIFYEFSLSKSCFMESIIPNLKNSLSLVLKHYFPLTGNLITSSNSDKLKIRYADGDSVSLTLAESTTDFNYLTGNHPRNADEFYPLVPQLPEGNKSSNTIVSPIMALQVTLFENFGLCFGLTFLHVALDATTLMNFLRSWASITRSGGDDTMLSTDGLLPFYDRTVIRDPKGLKEIYWSQMIEKEFQKSRLQSLPPKVRATFIMDRADVQRLKNSFMAQRPTLQYVSTYTVTCGYIWACLVKSRGEEIDDYGLDHFVFVANCRARFDPPLPSNYFGNCLCLCFMTAGSAQLVGEEGFLIANELIGEVIVKRLSNDKEMSKIMETCILDINESNRLDRYTTVAGSPKMGFYDIDFGWGRPKKIEIISIDMTGAFSLIECRDSEGDMEIGLSLPKVRMDAFTTIFANGLKYLQEV